MPVNLKITQTELKDMKTEKGSKLLPFKKEIHYLRKEECVPFSSIQAWLAKKGIDSTIENIRQFFERYKNEFLDTKFQFEDEIHDDALHANDSDSDIPDDELYAYDSDSYSDIPGNEYYPYDDDQDISADNPF